MSSVIVVPCGARAVVSPSYHPFIHTSVDTMPNTYRNKGSKPTPVQKAQTKQLSKLPLPPPRPRKTRSSRSMTDSATVASGTTYTSRVSKVSIKPREPVLKSTDPLSKAMEDKISEEDKSEELKSKDAPKQEAGAAVAASAEHPQKTKRGSHKGFAALPSDENLKEENMEEGIPTKVISAPATTSTRGPVVLPPPPPLDSLETYSLGTNDFISKYNQQNQSSCRNWRFIICIASILLLAVIAAAVVSVVLVLNNDKNESAVSGEDNTVAVPSPAPTIVVTQSQPTGSPPPPQPTLNPPPPTTSTPDFAPIAAPISTPNDVPPPLERLVDFFSDLDPATALSMLDTGSPQYRAMEWLRVDVQQNAFTFASAPERILQRGALAIIYYSTLGDVQWTTSTSWLDSSQSECSWYGAICADDGTDLQSLVLAENNLGGEIPREAGVLITLEVLALHGNAIGGTIPTQVGQLTFLSKWQCLW